MVELERRLHQDEASQNEAANQASPSSQQDSMLSVTCQGFPKHHLCSDKVALLSVEHTTVRTWQATELQDQLRLVEAELAAAQQAAAAAEQRNSELAAQLEGARAGPWAPPPPHAAPEPASVPEPATPPATPDKAAPAAGTDQVWHCCRCANCAPRCWGLPACLISQVHLHMLLS